MSKLFSKWFGGKRCEEPCCREREKGKNRVADDILTPNGLDLKSKNGASESDQTDGKSFSKAMTSCPKVKSRRRVGSRKDSNETDMLTESMPDGNALHGAAQFNYPPEMPVSKDNPYYNMNHPLRGRAVIFNFDKWDNTNIPSMSLPPRKGSAKDRNDLQTCLVNLDFDVQMHDNLDQHEFWRKIREVRDEDHRARDCLVVSIMTHGEKNHIYVKDGTLIPVNLVWEEFEADRCPALAGKPKIFIIQACRGSKYDHGTRLYGSQELITPSRQNDVTDAAAFSYVIPNAADIFVAFSCPLGQYSWRSPSEGSWFIQAVCKVFREQAYNTDLQSLFTHVAREVAVNKYSQTDDPASDKKVQVTSSSSTLIRIVQFRPKGVIVTSPAVGQTPPGIPFESTMGTNSQLLPSPVPALISTIIEEGHCGHSNAVMELEVENILA